ncbi:hypothetical protein D3C71_1775210 [compost metagenome]
MRLSRPGRKKPNIAQISNRVAAPNTQRQNTTSSTGWPLTSTNQPMVPEISMAAVISSVPRRKVLSMIRLLEVSPKYANPPRPLSMAKCRLNCKFTFITKADTRICLTGRV